MTGEMPQEDRSKEAIAWYLRLQGDADEATWISFTSWLEADPANRAAFDDVENIDGEVTAALERETRYPVIAFRRKPSVRAPFRAGWLAAAGGIAAVILVALLLRPISSDETTVYATGSAETRTIILADGSKIVLNARTSLSVKKDEHRMTTLNYGEAMFQIAHDPTHPFMVRAGDRTIRDIGTVFDVSRNAGILRVVVAEGRVGVSTDPVTREAETQLGAGLELVHHENRNDANIRAVDLADATAWQKGYMIYRNAPLPEIVADLNRYFATPIVIEGKASRRFSGALKLDGEYATVARLATFLQLKINRTEDGKIGLQEARATP